MATRSCTSSIQPESQGSIHIAFTGEPAGESEVLETLGTGLVYQSASPMESSNDGVVVPSLIMEATTTSSSICMHSIGHKVPTTTATNNLLSFGSQLSLDVVHSSLANDSSFLEMNPSPVAPKKRKHDGEAAEGGRNKQRYEPPQVSQTIRIFNLSKHILSSTETSLLSRGLNIAPARKPNPYIRFKDLNKYIINLTQKRFF